MRLGLHEVRMVDRDVWRCAREAIPEHRAVLVELAADGCAGWGEASAFMTATYRSDVGSVRAALGRVEPLLRDADPTDPAALYARMRPLLRDCPFALGALDVAAHDLAARLAGRPLHAHLGLPSPRGRTSTYSIGLADLPEMVTKLRAAPGWAMYKVKLARAGDLDVLRALREHTDAPFWVDGNACWEPAELFAVLDALPGLGVVAVEQPFRTDAADAHREARRRGPLPIVADESVTVPADLDGAVGVFDGVNVKVLKSGGITPALAMLRRCRDLGLGTMLGCLPESSAGASATAHLAGLADHLDLDTIALLATDTGTGVRLDATGRVVLAAGPGSGFVPDRTAPPWQGPAHRWGDPDLVRGTVTDALRDRGVTAAAEIAAALVETSLLGVHTHGVRLLAALLDELENGIADPAAEPTVVADTGPVVRLDARHALGVLAGLRAADLAVERAGRYGVGVVGVHDSNHFGAAGHYARRIAAAGHLGLVTTSAAARVAPFGGVDPFFGTNPLAIAYGPDFCLDMATSQVCFNEVKERRRAGRRLEPGWAVDPSGLGTTDPDAAAALAPLGGYKGQGLAMAVTMLTSVLVGGALDVEMGHIGASPPGRGRDVAHLLLAIDPDTLGGRDRARRTAERLVTAVRSAGPADPDRPVLVPGDPQRAHAERQRRTGLELDPATTELLDRLRSGVSV